MQTETKTITPKYASKDMKTLLCREINKGARNGPQKFVLRETVERSDCPRAGISHEVVTIGYSSSAAGAGCHIIDV